MTALLHNISILILLLGIILLTIYITRATDNFKWKNNIQQSELRTKVENNDIYNEKVNDIFKSMFTESSILKDYQKFNNNENNIKLYIK